MIDERQNNMRYGDGVEENDSINNLTAPLLALR